MTEIGPGQARDIISRTLIVLEYLMLHTKIQAYRPIGSGTEDFKSFFSIYKHSGHLGHVT